MEVSSDRYRITEILRQRLQTVVTNLPVVLFAIDHKGTITLSEGKALERIGVFHGEQIGRSIFDLYKDDPEICEMMRRALAGEKVSVVVKIKGKLGKGLVFLTECFPLYDSDGRFQEVIGVSLDITDSYAATDELNQSEDRFKKMSEAAFEAISVHENGTILEVNDAFLEMFGYDRAEVVGKSVYELAGPQSVITVQKHIKEKSEEPYEVYGLRKDGTTFPADIRAKEIKWKGRNARVTAIRDVTESKQAMDIVKKLGTKYRMLIESIDGIVWEADTDLNKFHFVSKRAEEILEYPLTSWLTVPGFFLGIVHPDDRKLVEQTIAEASKNGERLEFDFRMVSANGMTIWMKNRVQAERENGKLKCMRGVMVDITKRKHAEEVAREKESWLNSVLACQPD